MMSSVGRMKTVQVVSNAKSDSCLVETKGLTSARLYVPRSHPMRLGYHRSDLLS